MSLNQKCTGGGGGGGIHNDKKTTKKTTTIPKSQIPKTKNTERKALFKGRVNTEAIQDQDSTATASHTQTHTHPEPIHPIIDSSCLCQPMFLMSDFMPNIMNNFVKDCYRTSQELVYE